MYCNATRKLFDVSSDDNDVDDGDADDDDESDDDDNMLDVEI
jgi:hypothetical protein